MHRFRSGVVGVSRRPARETIAFAVALAALATVGGVAAASVAGAAPASANAPASADATAPNATIDYDGDRLNVEQSTDATISGTTTLVADRTVTVRVRSSGEQPFIRQQVVNVSADGSFEATMDFSDVERGVEFEVAVLYDGERLANAPAVVGECDPTCGDSDDDARFEQSVVHGVQGETVNVPIDLENRDTATLVVGGPETNMHLAATVTDGNGDGTVVVELETTVDEPGQAGVSVSAAADSVRVHDDLDRPQTMDPAEYSLRLFAATTDDGGDGSDVAVLPLSDATDEPQTTRTTEASGTDETETTTVGTVYESATTELDSSSSGFGLGTMGILAVGGLLAVLGIVALVGGLD